MRNIRPLTCKTQHGYASHPRGNAMVEYTLKMSYNFRETDVREPISAMLFESEKCSSRLAGNAEMC